MKTIIKIIASLQSNYKIIMSHKETHLLMRLKMVAVAFLYVLKSYFYEFKEKRKLNKFYN